METEPLFPPSAPYKYLEHYGLSDHSIFHGREHEIRTLVTDVTLSRLVVLFAETGTGKTSLINAGVRPRIERWKDSERPPVNKRDYVTYYVRVTEEPARSLHAALHESPEYTARPNDASIAPALLKLVRRLERPIVLFLDQFEEFFLYRDPAQSDRKKQFVDDVASLYRNADSGIHIVFSMREEFLGKMDVFREDIPTIFHRDSQLRLRWFTREQAFEAIVKPAESFGVAVDEELVDMLLNDLMTPDGIEPAQLQIVCDGLWKVRGPFGYRLTMDHFVKLAAEDQSVRLTLLAKLENNFARRVLGCRFERELQGLQQKPALETLAALLPELCTPEGTKRIRDEKGLLTAPGIDASTLPEVINYLIDSRLIKRHVRDSSSYVELSHDYLVKQMPALILRVSTLRSRRLLRDGMEAFRTTNALFAPESLEELAAQGESITLDRDQAKFLFLSALEWGVALRHWFGVMERYRGVAWGMLSNAVNDRSEVRAHQGRAACDLLAELAIEKVKLAQSPGKALELLERAFDNPLLAATAIDAVKDIPTARVVERLRTLVNHVHLGEDARAALRSLVRTRDQKVAALARNAIELVPAVQADGTPKPATKAVHEPGAIAPSGRSQLVLSPAETAYIHRMFRDGSIIPFLGAGVNLGARPPGWVWKEGAPFLPTGGELGRYLAAMSQYPLEDAGQWPDFVRVASYYATVVGHGALQQQICKMVSVPQAPTRTHEYLAANPSPLLILTTNYDNVMERALEKSGRPYDVVTHDTSEEEHRGEVLWWRYGASDPEFVRPNRLLVDLDKTTVIYKLAGSYGPRFDRGSTLATEDDYIDFIAEAARNRAMPPVLAERIVSRPLLFLGISLDQWYVRAMMRLMEIGGSRSKTRSWAVLFRPSPWTEQSWNARGVRVCDMTADDFFDALRHEAPV